MSLALQVDPGLTDRWRDAVNQHKAHALLSWPHEACGLILQDGSYAACHNISADSAGHFEIDPEEFLRLSAGRPLAVLHSHPSSVDPDTGAVVDPMACPSSADMITQADMACPWGITVCHEKGAADPIWFGDQIPRAPLIGRPFVHGVHDCYSLVRDWHLEQGITIPNFPRDPDWWNAGEDLYGKFEEAGFARVYRPKDNPLPGDCFICKVRSPVPNHAGVYLGGGLILHHLLWQLSQRQPASVWRTKMDFLVRHKDLPEDWAP